MLSSVLNSNRAIHVIDFCLANGTFEVAPPLDCNGIKNYLLNADYTRIYADLKIYLRKSALDLRKSALKLG